jgi:DNA-directed RNA polymerase omega subunit
MSIKYDSRGSLVDKEKCVRDCGGNQFDLVVLAAARAREIKQNNKHSRLEEHLHGPVSALLEIQSGKIDQEFWKRMK